MNIIPKIRTMEAANNYSYHHTAMKLGISPQTYYRKIKNNAFSISDLQKIADALEFDMEIVFTDRKTGKRI